MNVVAGTDKPMTVVERDAFLKRWFDFWYKQESRPGGAKLDEAAFRDLIMGPLAPSPAPDPKK